MLPLHDYPNLSELGSQYDTELSLRGSVASKNAQLEPVFMFRSLYMHAADAILTLYNYNCYV